MSHKNASPELFRQLFNLATLLTLTTVWMLLAMGMLRSGLGDATETSLAIFVFVLLSIWLPVYAISTARAHWLEASSLALTFGMLFPILGLLIGKATVWVAMAVLGAVVAHLAKHRPRNEQPVFWPAVFGSALLAGVLLSLGSAGRFFLPEEMIMGSAHSDSYFHTALAAMIAKFHTPSIGADGLELTRYHFGSHFVAGGLAESTETRVSEIYTYWGAIALRIQVVWSLLWCNLHLLSKRNTPAPIRTRKLLLIAFVGFAASFFNSESFLLAIAIFLGTIPLIANYLSNEGRPSPKVQFCIILMMAFICAAAKVSVGYFVAMLLIYAACRDYRNTPQMIVTLVGMCALAICTLSLFHPRDISLIDAGFGILLASYLQYATPTTLVSFTLPVALLLLQFVKIERGVKLIDAKEAHLDVHVSYRRGSSLSEFLRVLSSLKGEWQILFVSLVACILVVLTIPIGSNAAYFSGVLLFMSFAMTPRWVFQLCAAVADTRLFKLSGLVLFTMLGVHLVMFGLQFKAKAEQVVACGTCAPASNAPPPRQQLLNSLREHRAVWATTQARMSTSAWSSLIRDIERFTAGRTDTTVFVPPEHRTFWKRLQPNNPYWCISAQLMIPAQTGVPMLRGIGPAEYEPQCMPVGLIWYGFGREQNQHRTGDFNDKQLCELAASKNFNRVYVLNSIEDLSQNRKLSCS